MKNRIGIASLLFLITLPILTSQITTTPTSLSLTIYSDGVVHTSYLLTVNQSHPSINVTLFGSQYENIIIRDENGSLLDYQLENSIMTVDTLGADTIQCEFDVLDLTNKTLGVWILSIHAPINFTVTFPINTTIIDLSSIPLEILSQNQQTILIMPEGSQMISYIVASFTPEEEVRELLDLIHTIIATLQSKGIDTSRADELIQQAELAYTERDYVTAEQLANQALEIVLSLESTQTLLAHALPYLITASIVAPTLVIIFWKRKKRDKIDPNHIFTTYPWLREDQKDVIRFLATRKEGIFESELRTVFQVPKSSMWRLIKRLEEENILIVTQIKGQNYIKLKKP
jgi:uncharacterized membrane protein